MSKRLQPQHFNLVSPRRTSVVRKQPKRLPRPCMDEYGRTALHYAAAAGDVSQLAALLDSGLSPSAPDDDGWTPLHFAVQAYAPAVCAALLEAGATVDAADSRGNTPLWRAVFDSRGRGEVIAVLRGSGADANRANANGVTPAGLAARIGNFDVAQFFRGG